MDQARAAKLRALVDSHWRKGVGAACVPLSFDGGAALVSDVGAGPRGWVLIDDGLVRRFGPALALCVSRGAGLVDVVASSEGGVIARRAGWFPGVAVWSVVGRSLVPAVPAAVLPAPAADVGIVSLLESHGCSVIVEDGLVVGEVLGLEVARAVDGVVSVGVGRHDRYARSVMRSSVDVGASLDEAVAAVRSLRRFGAAVHPANTLRRSRWLRSVVCAAPSVVGASSLSPVPALLPGRDLTEDPPAACVGDGVVAVCSVGIDLDLVPSAADYAGLYGGRLVIVVPVGDDVAMTRALAERLSVPASVVTVSKTWASGL